MSIMRQMLGLDPAQAFIAPSSDTSGMCSSRTIRTVTSLAPARWISPVYSAPFADSRYRGPGRRGIPSVERYDRRAQVAARIRSGLSARFKWVVDYVRRLIFDISQIRRTVTPLAEIHAPVFSGQEQQRLMGRDAAMQVDRLAQHQEVIAGLIDAVRATPDRSERARQPRTCGAVDEAERAAARSPSSRRRSKSTAPVDPGAGC